MASIRLLNPKADLARAQFALQINSDAARGLQDVLSTSFGPKGTMKMLVSGAGDIKITKDGSVLLSEMQINHPTAALISRVASTQDEITGDGSTSTIILVGEFLRLAQPLIHDGMHPRLISAGYTLASEKSIELLDKWCIPVDSSRQTLISVAKTSLCTKVAHNLVPLLADAVVDAVLAIRKGNDEPDLHMVEIMEMLHHQDVDTRLIRGLVLDHGGRHANMPKHLENCFLLTCNVSLEYEKTEINSGYFYKTAEERVDMAAGEHHLTDERVKKIISLKRDVCGDSGAGFVVINQKGIDPISLDMLAKEGILALRRAKRRNMERVVAMCGGVAVNSFENLSSEVLGKAGSVSEYQLGEEKFTFIEDVPLCGSVTILINGPTRHCLTQIKDSLRDGLRAVRNALVDRAGSIQIALREELLEFAKTLRGKEKLGVVAFADSLLVLPRLLAKNAGLDPQEVIVKLAAEYNSSKKPCGIDLSTGDPIDPVFSGIYDNYIVVKQMLIGCTAIGTNLLLVDEIIRAGVSTAKGENKIPQ